LSNFPSDSTSTFPQRLAWAGGFGHAGFVFDELLQLPYSQVTPCGFSPAYPGEDIERFAAHPWVSGVSAPSYASPEELLKATAPDVLVVSTRPDRILPVALAGLAAGCHLILEKPVALDGKSLEQLHQAAGEQKRKVMAMLSMRSVPVFVQARERILAGEIGTPILINTRKSYQWGSRPAWFNKREIYGGTWPWIGIHNLDMAHFLTGCRALGVSALHANACHPGMPDCEDVACAVFSLEGGVKMTASIDLCRPATASTWGDDWCRVVGSEGVLEASSANSRLTIVNHGGRSEIQMPAGSPAPIYGEFLRSLATDTGTFDSTAFHLTAAALAARDSADSGCQVKIDPARWDIHGARK